MRPLRRPADRCRPGVGERPRATRAPPRAGLPRARAGRRADRPADQAGGVGQGQRQTAGGFRPRHERRPSARGRRCQVAPHRPARPRPGPVLDLCASGWNAQTPQDAAPRPQRRTPASAAPAAVLGQCRAPAGAIVQPGRSSCRGCRSWRICGPRAWRAHPVTGPATQRFLSPTCGAPDAPSP